MDLLRPKNHQTAGEECRPQHQFASCPLPPACPISSVAHTPCLAPLHGGQVAIELQLTPNKCSKEGLAFNMPRLAAAIRYSLQVKAEAIHETKPSLQNTSHGQGVNEVTHARTIHVLVMAMGGGRHAILFIAFSLYISLPLPLLAHPA